MPLVVGEFRPNHQTIHSIRLELLQWLGLFQIPTSRYYPAVGPNVKVFNVENADIHVDVFDEGAWRNTAAYTRNAPGTRTIDMWHQDGSEFNPNRCNTLLWSDDDPTEFAFLDGSFWRPEPYQVVFYNNLLIRHRRHPDALFNLYRKLARIFFYHVPPDDLAAWKKKCHNDVTGLSLEQR